MLDRVDPKAIYRHFTQIPEAPPLQLVNNFLMAQVDTGSHQVIKIAKLFVYLIFHRFPLN